MKLMFGKIIFTLFAFCLFLTACILGDDIETLQAKAKAQLEEKGITKLNSVTADGSSTQTTTQLTITFSSAITELTAADITLTGVSGLTKGALSGNNPYTLPISGFFQSGTLTVAVEKTGYNITSSPKTVKIYFSGDNWESWAETSSGVNINHSVANDWVCTVTVSGTVQTEDIGKANASYKYYAQAGKHYEYKFEAWTDGDERSLGVLWYQNNDDQVWLSNEDWWLTINSTRKTYSITSDKTIPKSGETSLLFTCANQLGTFYIKILSISIAEDISTYTVTYNVNGGSGTAPAAQTVNKGASVTLASGSGLSKSGYSFGGWNTNTAGTGTNYSAGSSYTPTDNVTLYAKWNAASTSETVQGTYNNTIPHEGLVSYVSSYQIVNLASPDNRQAVMKVSPSSGLDSNTEWYVVGYPLDAYYGTEITITFSVDVKRIGAAGNLYWQINNDDYPIITQIDNAATDTWHSISGTWTGTPSSSYPKLYLSTFQNNSGSTTYYIDNFTIDISY